MKRIACIKQRAAFLPSFSAGTRHNSTEVPSNPIRAVRTVRVPVVRLGGVVIPSVEEIRAKAAAAKKPSYAADTSYLDNASNNYLAAKLKRLGRGEAIAKETPEAPEILRSRRAPPPTPEDIATLTAKRREDRKTRTADNAYNHLLNYVPVPEKSELLRSEFAKSKAFMSPASNRPKKRVTPSHRPPHVRVATREQQEANPQRKEWPKKQNRRRAPAAQATQSATPSNSIDEEIDEAVFQPGHEPEFNGPELPSSNLLEHLGPYPSVTVVAESGTAIRIPVSKVDSFYKSDYSRYVSASKEDYASPPDALDVVKVAERILSHQRHYNLTARDRTAELVAQVSQVSKPAKVPQS